MGVESWETFKRVMAHTPAELRRRITMFALANAVVAWVEMLSLGAIAFFASSVTNPKALLSTGIFAAIAAHCPYLGTLDASNVLVISGGVTLFLLAVKAILKIVVEYWGLRCIGDVAGHMGNCMITGLMQTSYIRFARENSSDLVTAVLRTRNCSGFLYFLSKIVSDLLLVSLIFLMLLVVNTQAVIIAVVAFSLPALLLFKWVRPKIASLSRRRVRCDEVANRSLLTALHAMREVRVYRQEYSFRRKIVENIYDSVYASAKVSVLRDAPSWVLEVVGFAMLLGVVVMMYLRGNSSVMVTGTVVLMAVAAWRLLPSIIRIMSSVTALGTFLPEVNYFLRYMESIRYHPSALGTAPAGGGVSFERALVCDEVSYEYEERNEPVLAGLNFSIGKGEMVGIVGRSGAGKSTLADLLIGLLEPMQGTITMDGRTIEEVGREHWFRQFGYVSQSPYIYDASLAENVAFGYHGEEINHERVLAACESAAVTEFLGDLPQGVETILGERGIRLSGGQQQRICIARALYNQPSIIIFDEATSSLDTKSERNIRETISGLKGSITMVVVAHRLSTVEECDTVIWLEGGRVRLAGPPEEVLPQYREVLKKDEHVSEGVSGMGGTS